MTGNVRSGEKKDDRFLDSLLRDLGCSSGQEPTFYTYFFSYKFLHVPYSTDKEFRSKVNLTFAPRNGPHFFPISGRLLFIMYTHLFTINNVCMCVQCTQHMWGQTASMGRIVKHLQVPKCPNRYSFFCKE